MDYAQRHLDGGASVLVFERSRLHQKDQAGVTRRCSGTAGRIENCQVSVSLSLLAGVRRH